VVIVLLVQLTAKDAILLVQAVVMMVNVQLVM
jgi:hypothetical protein